MTPGLCAGVAGDGALSCVNPYQPGKTGGWLPPLSHAGTVDELAAGDNLCPWCVFQRALDAKVPGWTRGRLNRLGALFDGFNCMRILNPGSLHRHALDIDGETVQSVGGDQSNPDGW